MTRTRNPQHHHRLSLFMAGLSYASFYQPEGRAFHTSPPPPSTMIRIHTTNYLAQAPSITAKHPRSRTRKSSHKSSFTIEPRTIHEITIELPLGITLEELESSSPTNPSSGVAIISIHEYGNAAIYNSNIFSKLKSPPENSNSNITTTTTDCRKDCICIRDQIMSINGLPCHDKSFDHVITLISNAARISDRSSIKNKMKLGLGRLTNSTVVNFHNGIAISAKPGESYGFLAAKCGIDTIQYECRSGNCQTCMRWMEFPDKIMHDNDENDDDDAKERIKMKGIDYRRTILNCVGKVPRGYEWLHVLQ